MTPVRGVGPEFPDFIRKLRARPVSSWGHGDREVVMREMLQRLANVAAEAAGEPPRVVPDVGLGGLVDQLVVLTGEARSAGVPDDRVDALLDQLAERLAVWV